MKIKCVGTLRCSHIHPAICAFFGTETPGDRTRRIFFTVDDTRFISRDVEIYVEKIGDISFEGYRPAVVLNFAHTDTWGTANSGIHDIEVVIDGAQFRITEVNKL